MMGHNFFTNFYYCPNGRRLLRALIGCLFKGGDNKCLMWRYIFKHNYIDKYIWKFVDPNLHITMYLFIYCVFIMYTAIHITYIDNNTLTKILGIMCIYKNTYLFSTFSFKIGVKIWKKWEKKTDVIFHTT